MVRVACVMMERDEDDLLAPWLLYHGYLFGFENLYVFDNGSSSSVTLEVIRRFQKVGVNFDFSLSEPRDYEAKGRATQDKINSLHDSGKYDMYFPLDCDEFVVVHGTEGLTCCRNEIMAVLEAVAKPRGVRVVVAPLFNVPGYPSEFYFLGQQKVFFAGGGVGHLEHGNHHGGIPGADHPRRSMITYLHFHNRTFPALRKHALTKLANRVDVNDKEKLLSYTGHGDHLVNYFKMSERDYVASFAARDTVDLPEFLDLLDALGCGRDIRRATYADTAGIERTGVVVSARIDRAGYWAANPDVAAHETPPLQHYVRHGRRERRRLKPNAPPAAAPTAPSAPPAAAPAGAAAPAVAIVPAVAPPPAAPPAAAATAPVMAAPAVAPAPAQA
ncbi:MAG: glycosyltransferase family 2 protein [Acetobacteraceae bacterium]